METDASIEGQGSLPGRFPSLLPTYTIAWALQEGNTSTMER